jgi:hypothetical protein
MYKNPNPYIPRSIEEVWDLVGSMMLGAPTFIDKTEFFPDRSIETEFFALDEGLKAIRETIGSNDYQRLLDLSARMRAHFEADPEDKTGETTKGRECIVEMIEILRAAWRKERRRAR